MTQKYARHVKTKKNHIKSIDKLNPKRMKKINKNKIVFSQAATSNSRMRLSHCSTFLKCFSWLVGQHKGVAYNLEYENLKMLYLGCVFTSKKLNKKVEKYDGSLKINLKKVNLEKVVGNLIWTHSLLAKNRLCGTFSYLGFI